jgi:glutathione S-transferase
MSHDLTVWGVGTPRTMRVHWMLLELGLDYECHPIQSRTGETLTDEFRRPNPRHKIPVLRHGALALTESAAILHYLSETFPPATKVYAPSDAASLVFARDAQIYLLSLGSGTVSAETHARARDGFAVYAAGINQALSPDRQFLVGNTITIADICFVAELSLFFNERTRARELEKKGLEPILHAKVETDFPRA